jgi:hypothetical protein
MSAERSLRHVERSAPRLALVIGQPMEPNEEEIRIEAEGRCDSLAALLGRNGGAPTS